MKIPSRLTPLISEGMIDQVISRLMSGKEADVYIVEINGQRQCAKIYKDVEHRSFKQAVRYTEGRKSRNSRRGRAMEKSSKYGRSQKEKSWHDAEINALRRVAAAGVRVPTPFSCVDGVLFMELITDTDGNAAPRLSEVILKPEQAVEDHNTLIKYILRMLHAGIVHGDLSEFNILVDEFGPVIIDLPQAIDAAANNNAKDMLLRDVNKVRDYYSQYAPTLSSTKYGQEIWSLYESGTLHPDTNLTGRYEEKTESADVDGVLHEIEAALKEQQERLRRIEEAEQNS